MELSKQYIIIIVGILLLVMVAGFAFYMGFKKVVANVAPQDIPFSDCETIKVMTLECAQNIARQEIPTCSVPIQQSFLDAFLVFQNDILSVIPSSIPTTPADKKVIYFQQLSVADRFRIYLAISINSLIPLARCTAPKKENLGVRMVQLSDEFFGIV